MWSYFLKNIIFSIRTLIKNIFKSLIASFGILFLISFMVFYLSLRESLKNYIKNNFFNSLEINEIIISPKVASGKDVFSPAVSSKNRISIPNVKKIRAMEELEDVYSIIRSNYTAKLKIDFMGQKKAPYVPICGIEPDFLKGKIRNWSEFRYHPNKELPIIAPKLVLQSLNNYTAIKGLPQFKEQQLLGFPCELLVEVFPPGTPKPRAKIPVKIQDFSSLIDFPGILVPTYFVVDLGRKYIKNFSGLKKSYVYVRMYAKVKDAQKLSQVTKKIEAMNLEVISQSNISEKINKAMRIVDGISLFIGLAILILTIMAIFNSYLVIVYNRSYSFSLKRILGVSKIRIILFFMLEASLVGSLYGIGGFFLGNFLTEYLSVNLANWLPVFKGISLETAGMKILFLALGTSIIVSLVSAFLPALFAANKNLFKAVRQ